MPTPLIGVSNVCSQTGQRYVFGFESLIWDIGILFVEHRFTDVGPVFRYKLQHGIHPITQPVDEFFQQPHAEMILDQCAIEQFHTLDGMDEQWADEFGLNYAQMQFVQDAVPGSDEKGYSQALLGIDAEWRGMEVRALPTEKAVIDYEPASTQSVAESLPVDGMVSGGEEPATGDD